MLVSPALRVPQRRVTSVYLGNEALRYTSAHAAMLIRCDVNFEEQEHRILSAAMSQHTHL